MASPSLADSIDDQAAHWAVEAAEGELTAEGRIELESWLAADRRHRGAYTRASAVFLAIQDAAIGARPAATARASLLLTNDDAPATLRRQPWRPRRTVVGVALAASFAALIVAGTLVSLHANRSGATAEHMVKLEDGSVATLERDARIDVVLSKDARQVTLLSGNATFRVAKDQARPFVVRSGEIYAQATGTVYSVARVGLRGGAVKVTEGSVLVWARDQREQAILLRPGDSLTLDPALSTPPRPHTMTAASKRRTPAAASAQVALHDTPIRVAVARFNRMNSTKIVLADPAIGEIKIVGLFKADDPEEFARMAAAVAGGEVQYGQGSVVIKLR